MTFHHTYSKHVSFGAHSGRLIEDKPITSLEKNVAKGLYGLRRYTVYSDILGGFRGKGPQTTVGCSKQVLLVISVIISLEVLELTQRYHTATLKYIIGFPVILNALP